MSQWRARFVCAAALYLIAAAAFGQPECPNPVIVQIAGSNPSCASQSITLDAGSGWNAYQWSNGATTRTITDTLTATTTYSVTTTDAAGCSRTSVPVQVEVYSTPQPPTLTISPATICSTGTAHIDSNPSGWGWYPGTVWTLTNATITSQDNQSVDFTPTGAGPVTVNVTANDANGCPGSATASAPVNPSPTVVLNLMMPESCPGSPNSAYIDPPGPQNNWSNAQWSVTNGTITNQSTTSVTFTTAPSGQPATVTVIATDSYGCSATATRTVAVRSIAPPVMNLMMPETCPGSVNSAYIDPPDPQNPYTNNWTNTQWTVTNGTISYQSTTSVTFTTDPGGQPATVTVIATDNYGCSNTATRTVPVRSIAPPVMNLMMPETCPGSVNSAYIDPPDPQNPYTSNWTNTQWSVTNGTISYQSTTSVTFTTDPGGQPATVTVIATDNYGCSNTATRTVPVRSIPPPVMNLMMPETCPGSVNSAYIDPPDPQNPYTNWTNTQWMVTNGTISYQSTTSVTFTTDPGGQPATVTVIATDNYGCTSTASRTVPVRAIAPPEISVQSPDVCPTSEVYATVAPPDMYSQWASYSWIATNATITSMNTNSSIFAMADGSGPVTLTVTVSDYYGCSVTSTKVVPLTTNPPTAVFSGPQTVCAGARFSVTATDPNFPGRYYSFVSPNATLHSIEGCCVGVFDAGAAGTTIDIYVTSANSGSARCESWGHTTVTVVEPPVATITPSGPTTFCAGGSVTLTASAGANYSWSNGATTQSIVVSTAGSYSVTVGNAGCTATSAPVDVTVTTAATPTITASGPTAFCAGGSVTLTASAGAGYAWSTGATTQSISVSAAGSYSVTVTGANGCSATSAATAVTVNTAATPTITASGSTTFCPGGSVTLTASAGSSYAWSTGATTQSITVSASGSYTVTVTAANGCSATSAPTTVSAQAPKPIVSSTWATTVCPYNLVELRATPPAGMTFTSVIWSGGQTGNVIWVQAGAPGSVVNYTATATYAGGGCQATSDPFAITAKPAAPPPVITADRDFYCSAIQHTATATAGYPSYHWVIPGATIVGPDDQPTVTFTPNNLTTGQNVNFNLFAGDPNGTGCPLQATKFVPQGPLPAPGVLTSSAPFCPSDPATANTSNDHPGSTYHWTITNGTITGSADNSFLTFVAGASGNTTLSVTETNVDGCTSTSTQSFAIRTPPDTWDFTITQGCPGGPASASFTPGWNASAYVWSVTHAAITSGQGTRNINFTSDGTGPVDVTLTITGSFGCHSTKTHTEVFRTIPPPPLYSPISSVCPNANASALLYPSNGYDGVTWTITGGTITSTSGFTVYYTAGASGAVTLTATARQSTCTSTASITIPIDDTTPPAITSPETICPGGTFIASVPAGYKNISISTSNAIYLGWVSGNSYRFIAQSPGQVVLTFNMQTTSGSCAVTSTKSIPVTATTPPVIGYSVPANFCTGMTGTASVTNGPYTSYQWSIAGGTISGGTTGASVSFVPDGSGTTALTVTAADGRGNCTATTTTAAPTVNAKPVITASGNTNKCPSATITLTATQADTYLWSTGATTQAIAVIAAGDYSVTTTTGGCTFTSDSKHVTDSTAATIKVDHTSYCPGGSAFLSLDTTRYPGAYWSAYWYATDSQYALAGGQSVYGYTANSNYTRTYYAIFTDIVTGCSVRTNEITITVGALQATITAGGPTTFCAGGSVTLTANNGASYAWSNGATTQSITVGAAGSYTVTVTDVNGCSNTSAAKNVIVNPLPAATITASGPTTFCAGGSVTLTASAGSSYAWSNGATTQSITVNAGGNYSVTITNANGCSATSAATSVTVNPLPTATITAGGPTTFCAGGSVTLTASAGSGYAWSNGATTQSITVTAGGNYSVTVTNANGCAATSAATAVTVNLLPTPTITAGGPTTFCAGGSVTLTASAGSSYAWSNGATTQSITVNSGGDYSVTGTNANGCSATSVATSVTVTPLPAATITAGGPTTFCAGGSVTLTASAGGSYAWSNGATTQSTTVNAGGNYSVTVTTNGCSATSAPTAVTVYSAPLAILSVDQTACAGVERVADAFLALDGTYDTAATFVWSITNGTLTSINGSHVTFVSSSGPVTLTVTGTDHNGCTASKTKTIDVFSGTVPTITTGGPTTFCDGNSVQLTASPAGSYLWSTGETTPSILATQSGAYTVTTSNSYGCTATSAATVVTVHPTPAAPTITAGGPTTFCAGGSVTLTSSSAASYQWSNGATTQSITVGTTGSYFVTIIDANGCTASSASTDVIANPPPAATITAGGPTTFCAGGSVTLTASAGASYAWSNGATTQSITVNATGNYSVTVTNANGCSAMSAATAVTVNPLPTPTITAGGPTTFCAGGSVTLTASAGSSYAWSNGATTQSITVNATGNYSVTVTNANGCSGQSAATAVTVNPLPTATITAGGPTTFCSGGSVTLTASAGSSYSWSNGATTQSVTVSANGNYNVIVTGANGCSATSAATTVTVNPLPTATITPSGATTFCAGGSVTLTASAGASYSWSTGATTQSINVNANGNYSVIVTGVNGCSAISAATPVTVNPLPTATITPSGPTTFCLGGSVTLTASAGSSYAWSNGATTQSINVTANGNYSVIVTGANGCSATSAATAVTVNPLPTATITAGGPTTFCAGGSVTLTASAGASYSWSNGATTQSINVNANGNYSVIVTGANGCSATSAATPVTVTPLPAATITPSGPTTFCAGGSVTLTSSAGASYSWSNGATTQSIVVSGNGNYSVIVTSNGCSNTSAATAVTVKARPTAAVSGNATICLGASATITATLSGVGPFAITWSDGATQNVSGPTATRSVSPATTTTYTITSVSDANCSGTASGSATVTVNRPPSFTQPPNKTIPKNTSTTLTVSPTGTAPFTYQWYKGSYPSTTNPVATTQSYTTPNLTKGTYTYWVRVTNTCGVTNSATITVTAN